MNSLLAEVFSHKNKLATNYIFDILIEKYRYISFPVWLDQNKYFWNRNNKVSSNIETDLDGNGNNNGNNSEEEDIKSNYVRLKMFNIVIVVEKKNQLIANKCNLSIIYHVLESFSMFLAFEEYRNEFLGREIFNILKTLEKTLGEKENGDYMDDLPGVINRIYCDKTDKGSISIKDKDFKDSKFSLLVKSLLKFYDDLKTFRFFKININNRYDFKAPAKLLSITADIENYHTLVIVKRKQLDEWLLHNYDLNSLIPLFLNVVTPFKNFLELSLEHKIPLDLIKLISKQMQCLNLGKIVKKYNNNSVLTVNPNPEMKIYKKDVEIEFQKLFNMNIYESLNNFSYNKSLDKIFKKNFNQITNEKFIQMVNFLSSNEYLVPCTRVILPKLPFKSKYSPERILLYNSMLFMNKVDKLQFLLNDLDADSGNSGLAASFYRRNSFKNSSQNINKYSSIKGTIPREDSLYFEDVMAVIKNSNPEDYEVFKNFYFLLSPEHNFDQICYLIGYKDDFLLKFVKKYKFLFNLIIHAEDQ